MTVPSPAWAVANVAPPARPLVTHRYTDVNGALPRYDARRPPALPLGTEMREENHLSDRRNAGQQHGQPVDPDPEAAAGREPVFQGEEVVLVDRVDLEAGVAGDQLPQRAAGPRRGEVERLPVRRAVGGHPRAPGDHRRPGRL